VARKTLGSSRKATKEKTVNIPTEDQFVGCVSEAINDALTRMEETGDIPDDPGVFLAEVAIKALKPLGFRPLKSNLYPGYRLGSQGAVRVSNEKPSIAVVKRKK
jgi:hypothetical protein